MKYMLMLLSVGLLIGCTDTSYNTVKIGVDRYVVSGPDPNLVRGNAYKVCQDTGFDDYSVVDNTKNGLTIKCEKSPKSFFTTATEKVNAAWDAVKQQVNDYHKEQPKEDNNSK